MTNDNTTPAWDGAPAVLDDDKNVWGLVEDGFYEHVHFKLRRTAAQLEASYSPITPLWPKDEKPVEAAPDTVTATWRRGDDEAKWEAVKALLVEGVTVTVERVLPTYTATTTGAVTIGGDGDLYIGVGGPAITTYGSRRNSITSITVTAPDPKAALAEQLEVDGWAWVPRLDGGPGGYTYLRIRGLWYLDGDEELTPNATTELIARRGVTRHPAFVAGEAKGARDE